MRVLSVDTAGPVVGVGLAWDGQVSVRTERVRRGAEALLDRLVDRSTDPYTEAARLVSAVVEVLRGARGAVGDLGDDLRSGDVAVFTPVGTEDGVDETSTVWRVWPRLERDPEREVWDGRRAGLKGAVERFGADEALPITKLAEKAEKGLQIAREKSRNGEEWGSALAGKAKECRSGVRSAVVAQIAVVYSRRAATCASSRPA